MVSKVNTALGVFNIWSCWAMREVVKPLIMAEKYNGRVRFETKLRNDRNYGTII